MLYMTSNGLRNYIENQPYTARGELLSGISQRYGRDEEIPLIEILHTYGLNDTLFAMRVVSGDNTYVCLTFIISCTEHVLYIYDSPVLRECLGAIKTYTPYSGPSLEEVRSMYYRLQDLKDKLLSEPIRDNQNGSNGNRDEEGGEMSFYGSLGKAITNPRAKVISNIQNACKVLMRTDNEQRAMDAESASIGAGSAVMYHNWESRENESREAMLPFWREEQDWQAQRLEEILASY